RIPVEHIEGGAVIDRIQLHPVCDLSVARIVFLLFIRQYIIARGIRSELDVNARRGLHSLSISKVRVRSPDQDGKVLLRTGNLIAIDLDLPRVLIGGSSSGRGGARRDIRVAAEIAGSVRCPDLISI